MVVWGPDRGSLNGWMYVFFNVLIIEMVLMFLR